MTQMPNPNWQFQRPTPTPPGPPPPEPGWRFRWWILYVLAAIALVAFIVNNMKPSVSWPEIMEYAHVPSSGQLRYSQMGILGLVIVGILLVIKVLWSKPSDR